MSDTVASSEAHRTSLFAEQLDDPSGELCGIGAGCGSMFYRNSLPHIDINYSCLGTPRPCQEPF